MTLLLSVRSMLVAVIAVILLGLSIATIFPTVLGLAGASFASYSGTVFGILIGIGLIGGMTLPWIVGKVAAGWAIRTGLYLVVLNALVVFGSQLVAQRILLRQRKV
jgi:fucose permease